MPVQIKVIARLILQEDPVNGEASVIAMGVEGVLVAGGLLLNLHAQILLGVLGEIVKIKDVGLIQIHHLVVLLKILGTDEIVLGVLADLIALKIIVGARLYIQISQFATLQVIADGRALQLLAGAKENHVGITMETKQDVA